MSKKEMLNAKSYRPWLALACGAMLWAGGFLLWLEQYQSGEVRNQLISVSPWFLWLGFLSLAAALLMNAAPLRGLLARLERRDWVALGAVGLLAFLLVRHAAPRTHRLYYDEDIYQSIALNIAQNNHASMTNDGRWEHGRFQSRIKEYNKQPNAWPFLISLVYRAFGVSEGAAHTLNHAAFVLAALVLFLFGKMVFGSYWAGLFSALIYATIPENVLWSATVAVEPSTALFSLLAIASLLYFLRSRTTSALFLSASLWALAVQFRPEVLLLLGLAAVWIYFEGWEELQRPRLYGGLLFFAFLLSAHLAHLFVMRGESWGSASEKLSLEYFVPNAITNTKYYFQAERFPILYSVLMLAGVFLPGFWKSKALVGGWFLISWGIFLFFYAGSYNFGADVRFALLSTAPIALLAGRALGWVCERFAARIAAPATGLMLLVLGVTLLFYMPRMRATGSEAWMCRIDHDAAEAFAKEIPADGIVMTHNPNMFHLWGKNAAQMSLFTEKAPYAAEVLLPEFKDKIFIHWNYWCNTQDPLQQSFCRNMLESYSTELIQKWPDSRMRLELYRVINSTALRTSASPKKPSR